MDDPHHSSPQSNKSKLRLLAEAGFIRAYPLFGFLLPPALALIYTLELWRFRLQGDHHIVVSHIPTRLLAFHLAHRHETPKAAKVPRYLESLINALKEKTQAKAVVLNVSAETRRKRILARDDDADPFDRYLLSNENHAELYQRFLIWLAENYFGARLIHNEDLTDEALRKAFYRAFEMHPSQ